MNDRIINILDPVKRVITGLTEIDQDAAVLEQFYRASSKEKVIKRIDETMAELMKLRDGVFALTKSSYVNEE